MLLGTRSNADGPSAGPRAVQYRVCRRDMEVRMRAAIFFLGCEKNCMNQMTSVLLAREKVTDFYWQKDL